MLIFNEAIVIFDNVTIENSRAINNGGVIYAINNDDSKICDISLVNFNLFKNLESYQLGGSFYFDHSKLKFVNVDPFKI